MPAYGASLEEWAEALEQLAPAGRRDQSMEIAVHLGLAFLALQRLKRMGVDIRLAGKPLMERWLEQAWREYLYLRLHNVPIEMVQNDIERPVSLTRAGRIVTNDADQTALSAHRRRYGDLDHQIERRKRNATTSRKKRVRTRGAAEPDRTETTGSSPGDC